ncbi:hypothetical protein DM01DRAFT_1404922 [Hesseltinella vesiculosa]|uniref:BZIP domain-containing protein n=1 Tax=Hesseltinella vesiculosa TaxID=101127 RepID=A0A1X2GTA4_9FUNG|nr:hypothetical protein DM01DRAFT_1404922 [Hesseltinella vesiculosa]
MLWTDTAYSTSNLYPPAPSSMSPYVQSNSSSMASSPSQSLASDDQKKYSKKRKSQSAKYMGDEEKRRNFLERNRQAALKCRQRKKQWLNNLQVKVEYLTNDNEQLQIQSNMLREEVIRLRRLLWVHKDCHPDKQATHALLHQPLPPCHPIMMPLPPSQLLISNPTSSSTNSSDPISVFPQAPALGNSNSYLFSSQLSTAEAPSNANTSSISGPSPPSSNADPSDIVLACL